MSYILSHYQQPSVRAFTLTWRVSRLSRVNAARGFSSIKLHPLQFSEAATGGVSGSECSHRDTEERQKEREKDVSCSKSVLPVLWVSLHQSFCPVCHFLSKHILFVDSVGGGETEGGVHYQSEAPPPIQSSYASIPTDPICHLAHFFLPDFSERFASVFPPRSDRSDLSPLSLSFSFSFSFSARSSLSARSVRSPPRSNLLSTLLPSRRVPSSVDEVVGWGWPHLAISSCSEILVVMLVTHALRSSCEEEEGWDRRHLTVCVSVC